MKYLLTNGTTTSDILTYIKDSIHLNFKIYPSDLPYNTQLGVERRLHEASIIEFSDLLRMNLNDFINKMNARHRINLSVRNIDITKSKAVVTLTLGDLTTFNYDLPLTN